jgi:outer membrane protein
MKKLILFSVLISGIFFSASAQKFKYGHLNGSVVFNEIPDVKKADTLLKNFTTQFEEQIKKMSTEYEQKVKNYQDNEAVTNDLIKKTQVEEINALSEKIQKFQVAAQDAVNKKREELYQPIITRFQDVLKKVSKDNGLRFIIDSSKGFLLYSDEADDVTKLVEKELGIIK